MAYDDIRISELPSLPELHVNDLFLIQDVTNGLAHNIDWNRLKNSIGVLANGITFPLGTPEEPQIALGDYTSGIYGDDFGTFNIVTHAVKRIGVNQAGTIELVNGNILVGNYDRQCDFTFVVNNVARFNCFVTVQGDLVVGGDLDITGDITGGKDLSIPGNAIFGRDCQDDLIVQSQLQARCDLDLRGTANIHTDLFVDSNGVILKDMTIGSNCNNKLDIFSTTHIRCDLRVDGDLSFGGDLLLEGSEIGIGAGCNSTIINLNGNTIVYCDLRVNGITYLDSDLFAQGNQFLQGNLLVSGDSTLGENCTNHTTIKGGLTAECESLFLGDVTIGGTTGCPGTKLDLKGALDVQCDILGKQNLKINHDVELGTGCGDDLLVHSTSVFECDTLIDADLTVNGDTLIEGNLTSNGNVISLGDPSIGCKNRPNQIDLHGIVNIECDLNVAGDIRFDGNLGLGGALIALGEGCSTTDIILNGNVVNVCDTRIEGNLHEIGTSIFEQSVRINDTLNVLKKASLTDDLLVNQFVRLNRPVTGAIDGGPPGTSQDYWYHCCDIPSTENCAFDDPLSNITEIPITEVFGALATYCKVALNDPRWHPGCNDGASHVQITDIYGHLNARSNVDLNSSDPHGSAVHHLQKTSIWGQLQQYSKVELNREINGSTIACGFDPNVHNTGRIEFNTADNKRQTIIHGDTDIKRNVILNTNCFELTRINGKLEVKCESRLQDDVHLNGGDNGTTINNCGKTTYIHGILNQDCKVVLNDTIESSKTMGFDTTPNEEKTIIRGDTRILHNLEVGSNCLELTRINNKFQADCDVYLNTNCSNTTTVRGKLIAECSTVLGGDDCPNDFTRINGNLELMKGIRLEGGYGNTTVTSGGQGFFVTSGDQCTINKWHHAVTTVKGTEGLVTNPNTQKISIFADDSFIAGGIPGAGDITLRGEAGNTQLTIYATGLMTGGNISLSANESGPNKSISIGITKDIICGVLGTHTIQGGTGITVKSGGTYSTCADTTTVLEFDPSVLPDPCDKMKPLTITVNGFGSGGGTYDPCTGGNIDINIDEQVGEPGEPGTGEAPGNGLITIKQGGVEKGSFTVNQKTNTIINLAAGGSGANDGKLNLKLAAGSNPGIKLDKSKNKFGANELNDVDWTISLDPEGCPSWNQNINAKRLTLSESGGSKDPGIVIGTRQASSAGKAWLGIHSNQNNGSFTCHRGTGGWDDDPCGGRPVGDAERLFSVAAGTSVLPHHASAGLIQQGGADNESVDCFLYGTKDNTDENAGGINGGAPEKKKYNRFCFKKGTFRRGRILEIDRSSDSRVNIDIDNTIASLGISDDPNTPNGLFRWGLKPMDEYDGHSYPFLFIDPDELGARLPSLVDWTPTSSAWELQIQYDDDGNEIDYDFKLKDTFDPATQLEAGKFNNNAMFALSFAGLNRARKRLDDLNITNEAGTTTLQAPVKFEDIVKIDLATLVNTTDDESACTEGVEIGQVYRNGSQLMVRVS